jgi:predicted DNA binding protein
MYDFVVSTDISHFWFGKLVDQLPVSVIIKGMISNEDGVIHYLIEVCLNDVSFTVLEKIISDIEGIEIVNTGDITRNRVVLTVGVDKCDICQAILSSGCFLTSAWTKGDRIVWRFISPKKEYIKKIAESLTDLNINYTLTRLQNLDERECLSLKQEMVIRIALEKGYYDIPQRIGIKEIANEVGISKATVSELLRRGTKNLIKAHFYSEE